MSLRMIYKYPLKVEYKQTISLPGRAEVLTVQVQNGVPSLWVSVEPDELAENHTFLTFGTGHAIDSSEDQDIDGMGYVSTYQLEGGKLVFHVFEVL